MRASIKINARHKAAISREVDHEIRTSRLKLEERANRIAHIVDSERIARRDQLIRVVV